MKAVSSFTSTKDTNNQLFDKHGSDGQLLVELMQALQDTQKKAKKNPQEAKLNATTMSDNNGGRIIYNFNIYKMPQIISMLKTKRTIKKKHIEPKRLKQSH